MQSFFSFSPFSLVGVALLVGGIALYFWEKKRGEGTPTSSPSSSQTGTLNQFAIDLTQDARLSKIDPVIGRDAEIRRVTQILSRRTKNNVILVGPPGVGKTAIVEGLAGLIAVGDVPAVLKDKRVLSLRVSELLASTKYRGEFENRVKHIVEDIGRGARTIILFIDEIHTISQAKGSEGSINLSDILKPALARGDLQLIGATTHEEYEQFIAPDKSWERRFQAVTIKEPSEEKTLEMLGVLRKKYEEYHGVQITDAALHAAVVLSERYVKHRQLPDKAIDIIDEASAMVKVEGVDHPHHAAGLLHGTAKHVVAQKKKVATDVPVVDADHVRQVVSEWTELPLSKIRIR